MNKTIQGWIRPCVMAACTALSACATAPPPVATALNGGREMLDTSSPPASQDQGWLGSMTDKMLDGLGLKKPDVADVPDSALPDRRITWRIAASSSLNTTADGQPLSVLVRVYRLRGMDSFLQAPADAFGDLDKEKAAMGDELVSVKEVQVQPGKRYEASEKFPREIKFLGVVMLFRNPAPGRWRYAFKASTVESTGLAIGAHACAMSVQIGEPLNMPSGAARHAAVACPDRM